MTKIKENVLIENTGLDLYQVKQNKDDISANKLTTQQVSITSNYNHIRVYKYGNVVSIDIDGTIQESSGIIATNLPKALYDWTYLRGLYGNDYLRVDSSGKLYINNHTAGEWANIHGTYISVN